MAHKENPLFKKTKAGLIDQILKMAEASAEHEDTVYKLKDELRLARSANSTTSKALQDEQTEVRRLRKVLDQAITTVESRMATLRYVPPMISRPSNLCHCNSPVIIEKAEPTEEEKFLGFVAHDILRDQFKPKKSSDSGHRMDSLRYGMFR